ncbi:hypothetical protein [Nostoc sp.]|uniref:hypothetical protein n=1 Tax=Nostoc sp. TaxID=1180 RepID=UPI002FFACCFD
MSEIEVELPAVTDCTTLALVAQNEKFLSSAIAHQTPELVEQSNSATLGDTARRLMVENSVSGAEGCW